MADIREWLESLGAGRYADAFEENDIGWDVLPDLDHEVLKDIGVRSAGARLRILDAVAKLRPGHAHRAAAARAGVAGRAASIGEAERRQLTVMFCDLVGSTALAEGMDLEEYREVLAAYQSACAAAIERYDGYIARYMGDGLLVYFGYPQAHEDDAERAVRAGLGIVEAVASLELREGLPLQVRVGIATGQVVAGDIVGEGASEERAVLGDAPSLAARLQALAAPGTVVVSGATRDLTGRLFAYEDAGSHALKGFAAEVQVWRALSEASTESRFDATRSPERTALVGRDAEVRLLLDRWERAKADEGQVALLSGEAGIGKSRLIHALRERIGSQPCRVLRLQCSPHHVNSAFYPFVDHVERAAGIVRDDASAAKRRKLEAWLAAEGEPVDEMAPLMAAQLAIPAAGDERPIGSSPQQQKQQTIEALARRFTARAGREPLLLLFEDVQWADPTTLEVMGAVIDRVAGAAVLAIVTHRPEFVPPWHGRGHVTAHSLGRLGRREVREIVESMTGGKPLPEALLGEIVAKTDGVPLFVEELTKTVLEAGMLEDAGDRLALHGARPMLSVPSTLQDSLVARLDRLGEVKEVAQTAAVIGRDFGYPLLVELSSLDEPMLGDALARLEHVDLIHRRGAIPDATYTFKHALLQDAAYDSLLKRDRERLHARLSEVLEARFPEIGSQMPELLAHHYTAAGRPADALPYWERAAELALGRSAYHERLAHLDAALRVSHGLAEPERRRPWELDLELARGGALMATQGYRAAVTGEAFARAHRAALEVGDTRKRFAALRGLHGVHYSRAELDDALRVARECLEIGEMDADGQHRALAHRLVGQTFFIRGQLGEARRYLEQSLALDAGGGVTGVAALTGGGHRLMTPMFLAQVEWLQGFPDRALRLAEDARVEAERAHGAFSITANLFFLCLILGWRGEFGTLGEHAGRLRRLAGEHEIHEWVSEGGLVVDWPRLAAGEDREAVVLARQRLAAVRALGGVMTPFKLALLAEVLAREDAEEALEVVDEALALAALGERWSEPELLRVKGVVLLGRDEAAAEGWLLDALRVAREQGARSWELRVATDLARLRRGQGRHAEARDVLAPVYKGFTEGLETADLRDARRLLDALAAAGR